MIHDDRPGQMRLVRDVTLGSRPGTSPRLSAFRWRPGAVVAAPGNSPRSRDGSNAAASSPPGWRVRQLSGGIALPSELALGGCRRVRGKD
jgi:hypothetical protein